MQINLQHVFKMSASQTRVHASERLLRTRRRTFSETARTVVVSVGVSKLGSKELFFVEPEEPRGGVKTDGAYYRNVLLTQKLSPVITH